MIRKYTWHGYNWLEKKTRLAVALAGIAFADILMFMQLGFREALFDGNVLCSEGDIVLINPQSEALLRWKPSQRRYMFSC